MGREVGLVVDASVCAKWYFDEEHVRAARSLLRFTARLSAPDLLAAELGSIVWKRWARGQITPEQGARALRAFYSTRVELRPTTGLGAEALAIATTIKHSFYDCLYLALAARERTWLVTADQRLRTKVSGTPHAPLLLWIEDLP